MINIINKYRIYIIMAGIVSTILVGCTELTKTSDIYPTEAQNKSTNLPTLVITSTKTNAVTPTVKKYATYTSTIQVNDDNNDLTLNHSIIPNMIISLIGESRDLCVINGRDEIWYVSSLNRTIEPLLVNQNKDYKYPQWSPNGDQIAFVESIPSIITDTQIGISTVITGTDTIWVIDAKTLDRKKVSDSIPNAMFSHMMGMNLACDVLTQISSVPIWSPDGIYILFVQQSLNSDMIFSYSYYITQVNTGKTRLITTQYTDSNILWTNQPDQFLIEGDEQEFKQYTIKSIDNIVLNSIPFTLPKELTSSKYHFFRILEKMNVVIGYFYSNIPYTQNLAKIWKLDLNSGLWDEITNVDQSEVFTALYKNQILICDNKSNEFLLISPISKQQNEVVKLPQDMKVECYISILNDKLGNQWIAFIGSTNQVKNGIWAIKIGYNNQKPELIFDPLQNNFDIKSSEDLFSFSFQP